MCNVSHLQAIQGAIDGLVSLVNNNPTLKDLATTMLTTVPEEYLKYSPGKDFSTMILYLRATLLSAPQFQPDNPDFVGVPVTDMLTAYFHTTAGKAFFQNPEINEQMRTIINAWGNYLQSPESAGVLNTGPTGMKLYNVPS